MSKNDKYFSDAKTSVTGKSYNKYFTDDDSNIINPLKFVPVPGVDPELTKQLQVRGITNKDIKSLTPEKPSLLKEFGATALKTISGLFESGMKGIRATSQVLATPLAGALGGITGGKQGAYEAAKESLKMAKEMVTTDVSSSEGVNQAAQQYLAKTSEKDPLGGYKPTVSNVSALAVLGIFDLFGDPLFEVGALKPAFKSLKELAEFKKIGQVSKELPEETKLIPGTGVVREIPISADVKIKIEPKTSEIRITAYKKRFPTQKALPSGQIAKETDDIVQATKQATGKNVIARFEGDDLVIKPVIETPKIKKTESPLLSEAKKYKTAEEFVKAQGTPVYHGTFGKFDTFDPKKLGTNTGANSAKEGFFFSPQKEVAETYVAKGANVVNTGSQKLKIIDSQIKELTGDNYITTNHKLFQEESFGRPSGYSNEIKTKVDKLMEKRSKIEEKIELYGDDFFMPDDATSKAKGSSVMEVYVNFKNPLVIDAKGSTRSPQDYTTAIKQAKKDGYDGVIIKNTYDRTHDILNDSPHEIRIAFDSSNIKTKSQLTEIWSEAQKGKNSYNKYFATHEVGEGKMELPVEKPPKISKVAKSIETKAVEAKLTKGFEDFAGYEPITIKDQAERAAKLMGEDIEKAKRMVLGLDPVEEGLKPEMLIKAMEDYALENGDSELLRAIANSPLVSETSTHAQALRILAERNPESPVEAIRNISKAREKIVSDKFKKPIKEIKDDVIKEIKKEIKKPKKEDWDSFINSITCK